MKKKYLVLSGIIIPLILSSCSEETKPLPSQPVNEVSVSAADQEFSVRDIFAMDTFMTLKAYGEGRDKALGEAAVKITELEKLLSVTDEKSEVWMIDHAAGKTVTVSKETSEIISFMLSAAEKTNGALDPSVYPVVREWGFTTGNYRIPDDDTVSELLEMTGYRKITVSENSVTVPDGMLIDLGAAAKGYTGDVLAGIFKKNNIGSAVVSLGGNVQAVGSKPDGSDWKVSIRDPFDENGQVCIVSVSDKAVVTSGNYERFFTGEDGKRYCHIIDPSTGHPADNGLASVTVISESGILCDCLSTAMFVKGKDGAEKYWKENGGFDMIIVTSDGEVFVTEGIAGKTEMTGGKTMTVLK